MNRSKRAVSPEPRASSPDRKGPEGTLAGSSKLERGLVELFFKTVGAGAGFYDFKTQQFRAGVESEGLYQQNLRHFRELLAAGHVAADLETFLRTRYRAGDRAVLLAAIASPTTEIGDRARRRGWDTDLLPDPPAPLFHPALFTRTMPGFAVGPDSMQPVTRGTITPLPVFTLRQLADYYLATVRVAWTPLGRDQSLGAWNWLLDQVSLDQLLFAIDAAGDSGREVVPFDLLRYLPEATAAVNRLAARQSEGR